MNKEEPDRRNRILVLLNREDRLRYWEFTCNYCGYKVCEVNNASILALSDTSASQNIDLITVGFRCGGRFMGHHCGTWYYFSLSSK